MKIENLHFNYNMRQGWVCSIMISNGKGESEGTGLGTSQRKARWEAMKNAFKRLGKEIGEYKGGPDSDIMESTQLLLHELTQLKPG